MPATRLEAGLGRCRLRLRAGARPAAGRGAGVRDRRSARHLEPVRGVRRRRRLRPRGTVAAEGLGCGSSGQTEGRRGPRHVEQIGAARHGTGGSVLQQRFGRTVRAAGNQSAVHVGWWEADAWARWAGRRLATEVEWEIAAHTAARRGFRWADVHEWTAGTLQPWPGFRADPWSAGTEFDPQPAFGRARVLRGASLATRARLRSPKRRGFALPRARRRVLRIPHLRVLIAASAGARWVKPGSAPLQMVLDHRFPCAGFATCRSVSNTSLRGAIRHPSCFSAAMTARMASSECPPRSKKLSVRRDCVDAQQVRPDRGDELLPVRGRRQAACGRRPGRVDHRRRQRGAIDLAVGQQRQREQGDEVLRHHVVGQRRCAGARAAAPRAAPCPRADEVGDQPHVVLALGRA